jgi:peptidoglycan/xylan/chitin deacetylase (PgdA/CDA1 family)
MLMRSTLKNIFYNTIYLSGLPYFSRYHLSESVVFLTYHSFTNVIDNELINRMPIYMFERQIAFLKRHYHMLPMSEALKYLLGEIQINNNIKKPIVVITVDDGFADNYSLMFPVIKKYNVPVTVFISTDFIDTGRPPWPTQILEILEHTKAFYTEYPVQMPLGKKHEKDGAAQIIKDLFKRFKPEERFKKLEELRNHLKVGMNYSSAPLTWDQIREMRKSSVEFGTHTVYHSSLPFTDQAAMIAELNESKMRLEKALNEQCNLFSYPDGDWNENCKLYVQKEGYQAAVTQDKGKNSVNCDPYSLKRIEVPFNETLRTFACRCSLVSLNTGKFHLRHKWLK